MSARMDDLIPAGSSGSAALVVSDADTALALGSGDVSVLGTPRVVALCEEAAVAAIVEFLPDGATSVGTNVTIDHLVATSVGATVAATVVVTRVDGRKVSFTLIVREGGEVVAEGTHTRVVVDKDRFERALQE